jgi:hypothetical protein
LGYGWQRKVSQANYQHSAQGYQKQVERLEKMEHQLLGFKALFLVFPTSGLERTGKRRSALQQRFAIALAPTADY